MSKPNWNEKQQRWTLCVYENRRCIRTFTSTKKGSAGSKECLRKRSEWIRGETVNPNITVDAQWKRFMADVNERYRPEGAKNLEYCYKKYIQSLLGKRKLTSVTANEWQSCLNKARNKDGEFLSVKSVKAIRNTIGEFLKFCKKDGLDMPSSDDLYVPKSVKPEKEKSILTEEQMALVFDDDQPFAELYYIPFFRFALATGLRPGEIAGLRQEDYDGTFVSVKRSVNTNTKSINEGGKTENAVRKIALSSLAKASIDKQIAQTANLHSEYIFCRPDGELARTHTISGRFKKLCKMIGAAEDISLYSCRHTFISYASRILPESVLKSIVGHSVNMTTLQTYSHTTDQMLKETAEVLDQQKFGK